ncbi:MAG: ParA family protein [Bdellovibrionales bacterium]|nr:ParA family protein [Bdellovibrionales bacterium]
MPQDTIRYAIWNNKGGVGKTFLSFMLSVEYAIKNPSKKIIVVDMCPQANLSEIFLGGNNKGSKQLEKFIKDKKTVF